MIKRGIVGLHRGLSKHVKLSLYGLEWHEVEKVRDAFHEITEKYAEILKSEGVSAEKPNREHEGGKDDG